MNNMPINSIVQIQVKIRNQYITVGTGFLISEEGHIATCTHIFQDINDPLIKVVFRLDNDGEVILKGQIYRRTPSLREDVAILTVNIKPLSQIKPLVFSKSETQVYNIQTFGFPDIDNFDGINSYGNIIGYPVYEDGICRIQARFEEVEEGFSGAPVWNADTGEIIGMICKIVNPSSGLRNYRTTFITPISTVKDIYLGEYPKTHGGEKKDINDTYYAEWHLLSPFYTGVKYQKGLSSELDSLECTKYNNYIELNINENNKLYWFDYGVCVWHVKMPISGSYIFEFAINRRIIYKIFLDEPCYIRHNINSILNSICVEKLNIEERMTNNNYVLSMVDIIKFDISNAKISNVLKLFSSPSILGYGIFSKNKSLSEIDINSLIKTENDLLSNGVFGQEYCDFSVNGVIDGYASWAGVAFLKKDTISSTPFIELEINLQSLWCYLNNQINLIKRGDHNYVIDHFKANKIRSLISDISSISPRDQITLRLYREALIKTSRIEQLYNDFKELINDSYP